jgi:putative ABC transport system permease protein
MSKILQLFWRASRVQAKRATLTVAAIAWGSLSLVLLLAFGDGLAHQLDLAGAGLGRDLAIFWPGETTKPWQGLPAGRPIRPKIEDIELIEERVPDLAGVSGEIVNWRTALTFGDKTVNGRMNGVSLAYGWMRNHIADAGGRFLNPLDDAQRRRVIFLGNELAEDLFAAEEPVGQTLLVDNVPYTVVGVMKRKMQNNSYGGMDEDHAVIPLRTFWAQYGRDRLSNIVIRPEDRTRMDEAVAELRAVLAAKYGFDPEDDRALGLWDTVEGAEIFAKMMLGINIFLGIIGALTLIVGGVGVANIMYAVVKERTREIGVKMALGARSSWVIGPIVLEGLTYTLLGGVMGLVMATGVVILLESLPTAGNQALEMLGKPTLSPGIALSTAGILGAIGLAAGYFPARRAARVDPAETLRYE